MVGSVAVVEKIQQRGHWTISIRPAQYQPERLPFSRLESAINTCVVRRRGWPVPFIDNRVAHQTGHNWVGQDVDADSVDHYEAWRFYQSGQFNHLRAVSAEWREGSEKTPVPPGFDAAIEVWEILYYLAELFEFAGRLGVEVDSEAMTVSFQLQLRPNTALVTGFTDLVEMEPRRIPENLPERSITLPTEKLVAEYGPPAAEAARYFFERANWFPTPQLLQVLQRRLYQ